MSRTSHLNLIVVVLALALTAKSQTCNPAICRLPDCLCPGTSTPGGISPITQVPQIVYLTFDDAVRAENYPLFERIFQGRLNPNGGKISGSFFVTHEYTNYQLVHELYRQGHDIGLHSITHQVETWDKPYWKIINESMWRAEIIDQRDQIAHFAKIPTAAIKGLRAPFLQIGGDVMYRAIYNELEYDCSRLTWRYSDPGLWPYTMDYDVQFHDCQLEPCPTQPYPGFWEVPMVATFGNNSFPCAMIDACLPQPANREGTLEMIKTNFLRSYNGNRAPFGVFTHAAWLMVEGADREAGYLDFLDYLATLDDVFIVSVAKGLEWIKNPVPLSEIGNFTAWQDSAPIPNDCAFGFTCRYTGEDNWERYMVSCQPCPINYPWLFNKYGSN